MSRILAVLVLALVGGCVYLGWTLLADETPSGPLIPLVEEATEDESDSAPEEETPEREAPAPIRTKDRHDVAPKPGAIQGVVMDRGGIVVTHASVKIKLYTPKGKRNYSLENKWEVTKKVDDAGRFQAEVPGGGWYLVTAEAEGFAPAIAEAVAPGSDLKLELDVGSGLRGRVHVEGAPTPIAGCRIKARFQEHRYERSCESDEDGTFVLEDLPEGLLILDFEHAEYVTRRQVEVPIELGKSKEIEIGLDPGKRIKGTVLSQRDEFPLGGATVRAGGKTVKADELGRFLVRGLSSDQQQVQATAKGYLRTSLSVNLSGSREEAEVQLKLRAGATIFGVVTDEMGEPVVGAQIKLFESWGGRQLYEDWNTRHLKVKTDEEGRYELAGVPKRNWGAYGVRARHPDHTDAYCRDVKIQHDDDRIVANIQMKSGGTLAGLVTDQEANPVSGARVVVHSNSTYEWYSGGSNRLAVVGTDDEGAFEVKGLSEGRYWLSVDANGYSSAWKGNLEIIGTSGPQNIDIKLHRGEPREGYVIDIEDKPLAGVTVMLRTKGATGTAVTNDEGKFRIEKIPEGPYHVSARLEGFANYSKRKVQPDGDDQIRIELKRQAVMSGVVLDENSGDPVRTFRVVLSKEDERRRGRRRTYVNKSFRSREGEFTVQAPDGKYRLEVFSKGYVRFREDNVNFDAQQDMPKKEVKIRQGGAIEGYVFDDRGRPMAGARIYYRRMDDELTSFIERGRSEHDGYYFIGDLDAGDHDLLVRRNGFPLWTQEGVRTGGEEPTRADVDLQRFCSLEIYALYQRPKKPKPEQQWQETPATSFDWSNGHRWNRHRWRNSVRVTLESLDRQPMGLKYTRERFGRRNRYKIDKRRQIWVRSKRAQQVRDLIPGRYRVTVHAKGYPEDVRVVTLDYGGASRLDFEFKRPKEEAEGTPASSSNTR